MTKHDEIRKERIEEKLLEIKQLVKNMDDKSVSCFYGFGGFLKEGTTNKSSYTMAIFGEEASRPFAYHCILEYIYNKLEEEPFLKTMVKDLSKKTIDF